MKTGDLGPNGVVSLSQAEKGRDNILPKIMASSEGHSEMFQREIAKYDRLKADIAGAPLQLAQCRYRCHHAAASSLQMLRFALLEPSLLLESYLHSCWLM